MKKKSLVASLALVLGAGLSCDQNPLAPATTGSISVVLLAPSGASFASLVNGTTTELRQVDDALASIALTSARVTVTGTTGAGSPFSKTATSSTPTGSSFNLTVTDIPPGSYTVRVEGLANGQVAHFGETTGVSVTAGNNTPASVTFPVFQPQVPAAASEDTSDVLRFTVAWNAVQNATGYIVEWSQASNMTGASSKTVTGATTTEVAVTTEGKYFFTVKAVNAAVTGGGLASAPASVYVFQGVATVTVTPPAPSLVAGATQQMSAEARDADNGVVNGVTWFWASSNHTVATVNQSGLVSAVGAGTATITAVGKGMPGSTTLTVTPAPLGPAARLAFVTQPAGAIAGATMSNVQVAVQTASGQTLTTDNATQVALVIGTNAGGGTLGGTLTATVAAGVATFSNLSIDKAGNGYTLAASSNALTGATSSTFNISSAAATKLVFSIQPTSSIAGDALSPAVQVEIRDVNDNIVTSARDEITIDFGNNAGSGNLTGTKKVNAINGIASFSGLWVNKAAAGYTLAASATGLTGATSSAFSISPAAPFKLAFSTSPGVTAANTQLSSLAVTIADVYDNAVTTATNSVTISLLDNPWKTPFAAGGSLSGTQTVAAVAGVATFNALRIDKPGPGYTLRATSGLLNAAVSADFRVSLPVTQITTGGENSCFISTGGAFCVGRNWDGQGGVGTFSQGDSVAALVTGGAALTSITTGWNHTCALTAAGAAFCWGYNGNGRLGNNSTTQSNLPVAVSGSLTFSAIDTGNDWTCGLTTASGVAATDRQIYCWGYNGSGQLGNNSLVQSLVPVRVTEPFVGAKWASVSAGGNHTCGRTTTNVIYCWGYDGTGALGNDATLANSSVPVIVAGGLTWNSVVAGESHTCGIVADQTLRCWGYNGNGQLGDNSNTQRPEPVTLANVGGLSWTTVSAGPLHTCAITTTAAAYCWGYNAYGQLGDDTNTQSLQRVEVSGGLSFVAISVGGYHTCGRTALATYCWGANWYGQSGMPGTATSRDVPTLIIQ